MWTGVLSELHLHVEMYVIQYITWIHELVHSEELKKKLCSHCLLFL